MIAVLEGKVSEKLGDLVIIDCNGVGYGLNVSFEDFGALKVGESTRVYIYENIRESAYDLFGFTKLETKKLFEQLLTVKGIGPKIALAVLNIANSSQVRQSIAAGDVKFIAQANGVGRKAAERMVVELKDKVGLAASESATDFLTAAANPEDEALQGLVALGYSVQDAAEALKKVDSKLAPEDRIKAALKV
jgi:Holliday junction DNA helicase RuvA